MDFLIERKASGDVLRRSIAVASAFRGDRNDGEEQPRVAKHCLPTALAVRQQ
jgi:hypothetical protein